ncbi:VOC family protein [Pontibacillus salicampi]|uniref:VOC family protein n=1 Tax=Pontibacillus salicampi TaxID=1449801 RepID=A0ABV6LLN3_9BACI
MVAFQSGIHHLSAIVQDAQRTMDFYEGILGLRLVKKTVNFDDPSVYHLYFGDKVGTPGTILTFFPVQAPFGRIGRGQVERILFQIPPDSSSYWLEYLQTQAVPVEQTEYGIWLTDCDGLLLGLIEEESRAAQYWNASTTEERIAITGFYGAILDSKDPEHTGAILEALGFQVNEDDKNVMKYQGSAEIGAHIWINKNELKRGLAGAGTIHHIAFRTPNETDHSLWKDRLTQMGMNSTEVKDRQYFKSIYFHEPGGILFEIASDTPGFLIDEEIDTLGINLKLPKWLETKREQIEADLPILKRGV